MPRPPRPWFRMWSEMLDNAKLHNLNAARPDLIYPWLSLLALANVTEPRGYLPKDVVKIAFALRESPQKTADILSDLQHHKLIDVKGGRLVMHKWHDWNPDSDANLTEGRAKRNERTPKERGKNAVRTRNGTEQNAVRTPLERLEEEKEKDIEKDKEGEEETETRAPANPFAFTFAKRYAEKHGGRPPSPIEHAAALALEREYGSDACIQAASDFDWQKHPNYLRPVLQERRDKPREPVAANGIKPRKSLIYD